MPKGKGKTMWRKIKGFESLYEISNEGEVRNLKTGALITGSTNSYGYRVVRLRKNGKNYDYKLHRLLAKTFIENPFNYDCVNHIDGNKLNNSLENLKWCTRGYNNKHAREQLSLDFSEKPIVQSTLDGKFIALWRNANMIANCLGFSPTTISSCCKGTQKTAYDFLWRYSDFQIDSTFRL